MEDEEGTIYSIEMQAMPKRNLAKRARYYQSNIDVSVLKEGEDFEDLPQSYVIFICNFDPFGLNLAKYTYTSRCEEQLDHKLEDGTAKIFINAKGMTDNLTPGLKALVSYISHPEEESSDPLVGAIEKEINKIKETPKRRNDFMTYTQAIYEARREAAREAAKEAARETAEKAKKENEAKMLAIIRNLMGSMNLTFDQAMEVLMIEEAERKMYAKAIIKEN